MTFAAMLLLVVGGCAAPQPVRRPPPPITETRGYRPAPLPAPPRPAPRPRPAPPARPAPPPAPAPLAPVRATLVVDAGHGGKDPGARGVSIRPEKAITLEIAHKLAADLRRRGANVVMTRSDDRFVPLSGRAALAERQRVDLFVSVHADAAPRAAANGVSVYIARNASRQSERAAAQVEAALRRAGFSSRGV